MERNACVIGRPGKLEPMKQVKKDAVDDRFNKLKSIQTPLDRLNGRSSIDVYEAAKDIWEKDDPDTLRSVIRILRHGERVVNKTAAAYALNLMRGKSAIPALERSVDNKQEHPKVRGQAAESLAHNHREKSHSVLVRNLNDPSKEVRFGVPIHLPKCVKSTL
jgi:HEAT repeat protein